MTVYVLGDCCSKHDALTAPVVYPYQVTESGEFGLRAEYRCTCGNDWSCWWDSRYVGWSAEVADIREDGNEDQEPAA